MPRPLATVGSLLVLATAFAAGRLTAPREANAALPPAVQALLDHGSMIEHDSTVAKQESGPHRGGGPTTAFGFFRSAPGLELVFRKRALHPGSAIGYHQQREDEIYYVLAGRGEFTLDGVTRGVIPGTAMLTRPGSSHGIRPVGREDLVLLISYMQKPRVAK